MTEKFKPYTYKSSKIYYPENHLAVEGFAEMLYQYPLHLKLKMHDKKIELGNKKYLTLLSGDKVWLVTEEMRGNMKTFKRWLVEQ